MVCAGVVVYYAAIMVYAVGNHKVVGMQGDVVAHYLVEYRLVNRNVRSLVFHDDHRFAILAENHRVAPFACPVDIDTDFVGHQRCWIMLCVTEPCREVLAHEFLGGERHIFVPERVERLDGSILLPETQRYCRQIQARKRILFHLSFIRRVCPVVIGVENSI